MRKIGLFGGTFNPPHKAHKYLAENIIEAAKLDKVIIMPAARPPHKNAKMLAESKDRLQMCRLTFFEDIFVVSDLEIKRGGKSYTVDTVKELKKLYPDDRLFLIIGSDMLLSFHRWYRYEEILSACTLCVLSRSGDEDAEKLKSYAEETLHLKSEKGEILILPCAPLELSSTFIREKIQSGKDATQYLEENTCRYIEERGLYR